MAARAYREFVLISLPVIGRLAYHAIQRYLT